MLNGESDLVGYSRDLKIQGLVWGKLVLPEGSRSQGRIS